MQVGEIQAVLNSIADSLKFVPPHLSTSGAYMAKGAMQGPALQSMPQPEIHFGGAWGGGGGQWGEGA